MNDTVLEDGSDDCLSNPGAPPAVIAMAAVNSVITIVGLLGNMVVIFVLVMARDRQDTSSVTYVLNLAVADFCFMATVPFKIAQSIDNGWYSGEFLCKFAGGLFTYLNFFVSPLFLMVMSIDRYLAVNRAVSSAKLRTPKSSKIVSVIVWLVACCAVLPIAVIHTAAPAGMRCGPIFPGTKPLPTTTIDICALMKRYGVCVTTYSNDMVTSHLLMTMSQDYAATTFNQSAYNLSNMKRMASDSTTTASVRRNRRKFRTTKRSGRRGRRKRQRVVVDARIKPDFTTENMTTADITVTSLNNAYALDRVVPLGAAQERKKRSLDFMTSARSFPITRKIDMSSFVTSHIRDVDQAFLDNAPDEAHEFCYNEVYVKTFTNASYDTSDITNKCTHNAETLAFRVWVVLNFFYSYFIPCAIIVICYMAILHKLYQPSGMVNGPESRGRIRRHTMRKKVTLMVATLVISYIVCLTPYYVWELLQLPGVPVSSQSTCSYMQKFNEVMVYVNSALNPILYTFLSDQFGSKFKLAWRRAARKTTFRLHSNPLTQRDKIPCAPSQKCLSPLANHSSQMIPRDSVERSSGDCNGANNEGGASSKPIKTRQVVALGDDALKDTRLGANINPLSAESGSKNSSNKDGCEKEALINPDLEDMTSPTKMTTLENIPLVEIRKGSVDNKELRRTTQLHHLADVDSSQNLQQKSRSRKRSSCRLLSCACNCTDETSGECKECNEDEHRNEMFFGSNDVTPDVVGCDDIVTEKSARKSQDMDTSCKRTSSRKRFASFMTRGAGGGGSTGCRHCKKLKNQNHKASKPDNSNKNSTLKADEGGWFAGATSMQEDSKFPTELSAMSSLAAS